MTSGTVTGDVSSGTDTLRSIEGIQGTNFADTYVATNFGAAGYTDPALNNVGNNGTFNQFEGLGDNDSITGNGNTRLLYSNATAGVTVTFSAAGTGTADGNGSVGHDYLHRGQQHHRIGIRRQHHHRQHQQHHRRRSRR